MIQEKPAIAGFSMLGQEIYSIYMIIHVYIAHNRRKFRSQTSHLCRIAAGSPSQISERRDVKRDQHVDES